jgi:Putative transposase
MLGLLIDAHAEGRLQFYGDYQHLAGTAAFKTYLAPLWKTDWFVYAKRPFAGPEQVLAYLSRYTHRVAISNSRLLSADASGVTFKYKDYRIEGPERYKTMTLEPGEFIRRFLMHVLPKGFHRIRHYGLLANGGATRAEKLARARELIAAAGQLARELIATAAQLPPPQQQHPPHDGTCEVTTPSQELNHPCPHCGSRMVIIETFEPGHRPRHRPSAPLSTISINTS